MTKEDILTTKSNGQASEYDYDLHVCPYGYAIDAMQEFADQELQTYKTELRTKLEGVIERYTIQQNSDTRDNKREIAEVRHILTLL